MSDRNTLYGQNVCCLTILKASIGLDLSGCPVAFPLPYGENLGETEALHLITAHELYNELRSVMANIQSLGIRELPVMLLIMMVAFFQPLDRTGKATSCRLEQPEKVANIQHYYNDKLQVSPALLITLRPTLSILLRRTWTSGLDHLAHGLSFITFTRLSPGSDSSLAS